MPRNPSASAAAAAAAAGGSGAAAAAAAAASARLHKQRHSENESARRARLKDKFLALAALLGQQESHSDHDSDTPTTSTTPHAAAAAKAKSSGGGGESGSRLQTLAMAIEKLHANRETIEKLEARCSALQAQLAASTRNNAAPAAAAHPTAAAAAAAAPSNSIALQQQQLQQQMMRQREIERLMASNASLQAQLLASSGGNVNGAVTVTAAGSGAGLGPHLDQEYIMSLVGQQQPQQPQQQQARHGHMAIGVGGGQSSAPPIIKRSMSAARLAGLSQSAGGLGPVAEQLYAHQPSSSAPPMSASAAAAERGLAQISLDRGLSSRTDMSSRTDRSSLSHASNASSSSFMGSASAMSLHMPNKRRRTTEDDVSMSGNSSPPTSSAAAHAAAAAAAAASASSSSPVIQPLSSYPLLHAQPCFLLSPSAEMIDCSPAFVRLLSNGAVQDAADEAARKRAVLSQSLFTLLHPVELKSTLALIKRLWTGAQAQAQAQSARAAASAGVNTTAADEPDTLLGIEDALKNFLPLGAVGQQQQHHHPHVLPVRLVLLGVMDRASQTPLVMLGLALPVQSECGLVSKSLSPAGFPHGVKACLIEMARECSDLLGDEQQRYLVAALYGTPKSKLDPASAMESCSPSPPRAVATPLRTSASHHNLSSMAAPMESDSVPAAALGSLHLQQQPYGAHVNHSRMTPSRLHYRQASGSLDASLVLTPTHLQRSRPTSPPPAPSSHYEQDESQLVPLQLRSPLVEAVPTPADHAPLDEEEAEAELPAFAAPSPLLLHRNSGLRGATRRASLSSADASVFRSPVDAAPTLLPDDDEIELDAPAPLPDAEGGDDNGDDPAHDHGVNGAGGADDDDADLFQSNRRLSGGGGDDDDDVPPFASPLLLHTLSGQSLPLSPLGVRANNRMHKQIAAGARAALIGAEDMEFEDD